MRAFMSDRMQRVPLGFTLCMGSDDPRLIVEQDGRSVVVSAPWWAEREAREILRETEPRSVPAESRYTDYVSLATLHDGYKALQGVPGKRWTIRTEEAQLLAEALKGFCEREGL